MLVERRETCQIHFSRARVTKGSLARTAKGKVVYPKASLRSVNSVVRLDTHSPIAGSFLRLRTIRHPNLVRAQMDTQKKRKVAQDIATLEQQSRSLSLSVKEYKSEPPSCAVSPFGTGQSSSKRFTMGVVSGDEMSVWPPELFPDVATVESGESRLVEKYFGLEDKNHTNTSQNRQTSKQSQSLPIFSGK